MHSLTSLPTEILADIVANLGPSQADHFNFRHDYQPDVSLYQLARTCKTLLPLCLPKLYEICNLKTTDGFQRSRSLLRTLATKPDIACLVKRVIVNGSLWVTKDIQDGVIISAEDAELFNRILEEKLDMATVTPLRKLQYKDELQNDHDLLDTIGKALACVALAVVPNVTSIIFSSHYKSLGNFKPGSFPALDTFSLQHADTEGGSDFAYAQGVLNVAPNVKRFFGWSITCLPRIPYPSIREVVLGYSCIDSDEAAHIPTAFPNLERFTYVYGGACVSDHQSASSESLSGALISLKKTLKHVELGTYDFEMDLIEDSDDEDPVMKSLSQMEVLETLRLPSLYICKIDGDGDDEDSESKIDLVDFLPSSIQSVYIEGAESCQLQDMLKLPKVALEKFPVLRHVTFASLEESLKDVVQEAYNGSRIECSFQGEEIDEYSCCSE
ncbi:hypothetical protein VHEMI10353 [[Torrubiella] hemipterigena]|uniref:F-box domain-containing protein n=1 Tax=[Torrubiella] hemipterigena TaxID=1531966 RepID=A0A0A1TRQ4_9HYPO|nr:hypothetical protein VHEMI10353 [[Torrubiella] hemipterigena]